jgi:hypothetical protein
MYDIRRVDRPSPHQLTPIAYPEAQAGISGNGETRGQHFLEIGAVCGFVLTALLGANQLNPMSSPAKALDKTYQSQRYAIDFGRVCLGDQRDVEAVVS